MNVIAQIENKIITISNQLVMIDSDVAVLYGVETKRVNEAVKNNPEKFPDGYILDVSVAEWVLLKSKFSTSIKGGKTKRPRAFTEKGLYMLATILKSPIATQTTISIIETFAKIRDLRRNVQQLSVIQDDKAKETLLHKSGELMAEILEDDLNITQP